MPVFLTKFVADHWKKLLTLCLFLAASFGSYMYGKQSSTPQVIENTTQKTTESEKTNEKTNESKNKEKVTVVIKHPDGTEETRITEHETSNTTSEVSKNKEKSQTTTTEKTPIGKKYRLGALVQANPYSLYKNHQDYTYSVTASKKFFDRVWVDSLYNFNKKEIGLGLSLEF